MLVNACALLIALAALVLSTVRVTRSRRRLLREHLRERFVVTLVTGETFSGLLEEHDAEHLTLVDARALQAGGHDLPVDGVVFLPRVKVAYMQRPTAAAALP